MTAHGQIPSLYLSAPHRCPYLTDQIATTLLLDPNYPVGPALYARLIEQGFRRSGSLFYRPHCHECRECVSVRVPARRFRPSRSQRRVWARNQDLRIRILPPEFRAEYFELYQRYQAARHPGGSMDSADPKKYVDFIVDSRVDSFHVEMRAGNRLIAVAACDRLADGISAIYTYYDPSLERRSLGTYAILWQIDHARALSLQWVYLGYWIAGCRKMSYKTQFRPISGFLGRHWRELPGKSLP